jgi:hypothetical protein
MCYKNNTSSSCQQATRAGRGSSQGNAVAVTQSARDADKIIHTQDDPGTHQEGHDNNGTLNEEAGISDLGPDAHVPHGEHRLIDACGDVYEARWEYGSIVGNGRCTYADGDVYEGEWKDGKRHGIGMYMYKEGHVYLGEWENHLRSGVGWCKYDSSDIYEGQWRGTCPTTYMHAFMHTN